MPKKTRKEKIIADLRRKIIIQEKTNNNENPIINSPFVKASIEEKTYSLNTNSSFKPITEKVSNLIVVDPKYIKADLRKTFLMTAVVLIVEFMLYWALERNGIGIVGKMIGK